MGDALKRAPGTMARYYKRGTTPGLRELLAAFDCQRVPQILFQYDKFSESYKGVAIEETLSGLEAETNLIRLPQVVHTATCSAFSEAMRQICEEDRCAVAHAFEGAHYTDANAIVWLVADVESKLEVDAQVADVWCGRLEALARKTGFGRFRIWLIANEGFTSEACEVLNKRNAYGSSRRQLELLSGRLNEDRGLLQQGSSADEFVMILPMGADNELVAANAVEQIARRIAFRPEAINQIKTAIVEACINAAEHSFSPDRKIYQRFRVENDRLVVTISSRGVVPANVGDQNGEQGAPLDGVDEAAKERRGWGLKLIKTLMDEVEFERVDDGTSLRMTKYLRNSSS
jgi:serine/threonine-protein kinase RsbW